MIKIYTYAKGDNTDERTPGLHIVIDPADHGRILVACSHQTYSGCRTCPFAGKCSYSTYRTLVKEHYKILSKARNGQSFYPLKRGS